MNILVANIFKMFRQEEPEVDFKKFINSFNSLGSKFNFSGGKLGFLLLTGILLIIIVLWLFSGVYTVQPSEQAALKLFGKYQRIEEEGLHWYWPSPVGDVDTVKVKEIRRLELGVRDSTPILEESLMITGDADEAGIPGQAPNIVDVQLLVQYNIKDVRNYLYQSVDPDGQTLKDASETALRQVVGSRPIDDVLTDKKEDVQAETKLILQGLMDKYSTGINITEVKLLNVFAPEQVKDAFDDVVRAEEDKAATINLADAYKEDILPRAEGDAAKLLRESEAYKATKIAEATGEADRFNLILTEYSKSKSVTRKRLYLEAMEEILPGITKFIIKNEDSNNLLQLLQLNSNANPLGVTP